MDRDKGSLFIKCKISEEELNIKICRISKFRSEGQTVKQKITINGESIYRIMTDEVKDTYETKVMKLFIYLIKFTVKNLEEYL